MIRKTILIGVMSASLFAGGYTRADRIADMKIMSQAMNEIQSGFFFNDKQKVIKGALKLSDTIRRVRPPLEDKEEQDPMMRYMNEKVKFSNKIVKKIDKKAETIIDRFRSGDVNEALQAYKKIMSSCMECHAQLRNW